MLVPGGSTISLLPSGTLIDLSGILTTSSGDLIGNISSAMGAGGEIDPAGWAGGTATGA